MDLYLVGLDHHVAPLDVRERLAVPKSGVQPLLSNLCQRPWAEEAVLIATCNRTELYVVSGEPGGADLAIEALGQLLPGADQLDATLFRVREGETAARHLYRVAAGLESAILGETEIQGQVREGHEAALAAGTAGKVLDRLARGAIRAGKRARRLCRSGVERYSNGCLYATWTGPIHRWRARCLPSKHPRSLSGSRL